MWNKVVLVVLVTIFLSFLLPLRQGTGLQSPTTMVGFEPGAVAGLHIGDAFTVNVTVSNVTDLRGWQFSLFFQKAVLNLGTHLGSDGITLEANATEGPFLQEEGVSTFFVVANFTNNYNDTCGVILLADARFIIGQNVTGVSGSGSVASIDFVVVGSGGSTLHLDGIQLLDSAHPPNEISFTSVDGWAYAGLVHVTVSDLATPINIPQGSMAYINVTAENRGGVSETFDVTLLDDSNPIGTQTVLNLAAGGSQTLYYAWDTTSMPIGEYTLNATATLVPGETDLSDKNISLSVYVGTRDIAATGVSPYRTSVPIEYSLGGINVSVSLKNNGQDTETFNVTLYYSVSNVSGTNLVDTQTTALISGGSETLTFPWNTSTLSYGNYTLLAHVTPLPYDINTADKNSSTYVSVTIPGDVNGDGIVNILDAIQLGNAFLSNPSSSNWNPNADINGDNVVNILDAIILGNHFLQHFP
ncbi:MAG: dockerin type I domain-containing protein [Candidatus Bathyarchaeia archaeon]|jgi:hypothetical protein